MNIFSLIVICFEVSLRQLGYKQKIDLSLKTKLWNKEKFVKITDAHGINVITLILCRCDSFVIGEMIHQSKNGDKKIAA